MHKRSLLYMDLCLAYGTLLSTLTLLTGSPPLDSVHAVLQCPLLKENKEFDDLESLMGN